MNIDEIAQARHEKIARSWDVNPLMGEIVDVLLIHGGSAHSDTVVKHIALRRSKAPVSEGLRREIHETFTIHRRRAQDAGLPPLVHLPFGEASLRWALTPDVLAFFTRNQQFPFRALMN